LMPALAAVITRHISMAMMEAMKKAKTYGVARAPSFQRAVARGWACCDIRGPVGGNQRLRDRHDSQRGQVRVDRRALALYKVILCNDRPELAPA